MPSMDTANAVPASPLLKGLITAARTAAWLFFRIKLNVFLDTLALNVDISVYMNVECGYIYLDNQSNNLRCDLSDIFLTSASVSKIK